VDAALFAALAEPTRLRIVAVLDEHPRPVGEVATILGLRQPQVTKHLQVLQRAGLVSVYPLGQRRIYALERSPLRELRAWLQRFEADRSSEEVLEHYRAAIKAEQAQAAQDAGWAKGRRIRLRRNLHAPPAKVWRYWTSAELVRRWWSPQRFRVADCEVDAVPGGRLTIVLEEGDGARHIATGHFVTLDRPAALRFELGPLGPCKTHLLLATHDVRLAELDSGTRLSLAIRVTAVTPEAAPALAGMRLGWQQTLSKLEAELDPAAS
jgi:uncharacterized protein YndB with AHSA1/START domain/DNA-binding transcriptional ArsR family regulator